MSRLNLLLTILIMIVFLVTTTACGEANVRELYRISIENAQKVYISNGNIYFPDGDDLKRFDRTGSEKRIYRDSELGIFMGFGSNIKTVDTFEQIIVFDANDKVMCKIDAIFPGQTFVSKNDNFIVSLNIMDNDFKMYNIQGKLIKDFQDIASDVAISEDGAYVITNTGYLYNILSNEIMYTKDYSSFEYIKLLHDKIFVINSSGSKKSCAVYDFQWVKHWESIYEIEPICSFSSDTVMIYLIDQLQCLNLITGETIWEKSYNQPILRNWQSPMYDGEFAVFQTADYKLHVLDSMGKEIYTKDIGKVTKIVVSGNLIVYQIYKTNDYVVMEIFSVE